MGTFGLAGDRSLAGMKDDRPDGNKRGHFRSKNGGGMGEESPTDEMLGSGDVTGHVPYTGISKIRPLWRQVQCPHLRSPTDVKMLRTRDGMCDATCQPTLYSSEVLESDCTYE
jgi:hypothetical protein